MWCTFQILAFKMLVYFSLFFFLLTCVDSMSLVFCWIHTTQTVSSLYFYFLCDVLKNKQWWFLISVTTETIYSQHFRILREHLLPWGPADIVLYNFLKAFNTKAYSTSLVFVLYRQVDDNGFLTLLAFLVVSFSSHSSTTLQRDSHF